MARRNDLFLSDRDWVMNVWSYDTGSKALTKLTDFTGTDVKWLGGRDDTLVFERDGYLHSLDPADKSVRRLKIDVLGDFPWAETRWEDVEESVASASLSATGKRALFEARGEIFTVPVEKGSTRNLTRSSGAADRAPTWSPRVKRLPGSPTREAATSCWLQTKMARGTHASSTPAIQK
jgi:tricorn protease